MHRLKAGRPAYFDHAATTPLDPRVLEEMLPHFGADGTFGNPSSSQHGYGVEAADAVEFARRRVARAVGAKPAEVIWTSGATEANNLAIRGVLHGCEKKIKQLVTVSTEHPAVLEVARAMRKEGFKVEILSVGAKGTIDVDSLRALVRRLPSLVSVMWVNNETGVVQPIPEIARACSKAGAVLHVDAAQAVGKVQVNLGKVPAQLVSLSAHKSCGPKGIGALVVRGRLKLQPVYEGGGQERGLRPGTLPVPLIAGMGKAFEIANKERAAFAKKSGKWHDAVAKAAKEIGGSRVNGDPASKVPHIINLSFADIDGNLLSAMPKVALSNGSACATQKETSSHVLRAMGVPKAQALASARISFGRTTTDSEVALLVSQLAAAVKRLRRPAARVRKRRVNEVP